MIVEIMWKGNDDSYDYFYLLQEDLEKFENFCEDIREE